MLDFRFDTFLTLCKVKNYTETAKLLHLTQPAVSQHIKYLEKTYNCKLFSYKGKSLSLTPKGEILKSFAMSLKASSDKIKSTLAMEDDIYHLKFGSTLTISEYTMKPIISQVLLDNPTIDLTMEVNNTKILLEKLKDGKLDFVVLEGTFDKLDYESRILSLERFIPICSPNNKLANKAIEFTDILNERLITREYGSGTRNILEHILCDHNLSITSFRNLTKIGSINIIKNLVQNNFGITFLYEQAVYEEIKQGTLCEVSINNYNVSREFNFVFLKDSLHKEVYLKWFDYFYRIKKSPRRL
ncbi:LysR family transcriptional regulator [Clostridium neonatale]|uniref:LysR family transcriptional regulator n=1 Tax=Clostridium neonatale TaxID=137838 RepID=UPI00291BA80B|nr:LysR family transcriptional regulator [Clostridium neonatale]CAI3206706.1 putative transcriptional regulator, LysR-type [Clostridium neonatale]CAI3673378.1 putative transcriptional regulator, LysR-type [Clostridium neonatale]